MAESSPTTIEQCRRCSLNNARGQETTYEDGQTVFKCDACGNTMYLGETEEAYLKAIEDKRGRERAQDNRRRYQNEVFDKAGTDWKKGMKERMGDLPDVEQLYDEIVNPLGQKQIDDGEVYREVNIV